MRWFWIDRFVEFRSGQSARAVKNVSLTEEQVDEYFPGYPVMPHSLVIEGLAQAGGLLVGQTSDFRNRVVLAKISRATFFGYPRPADTLRYEVVMQSQQADGALVTCTSHIGEQLHAEVDLYFAHLNPEEQPRELFEPAGLLRMLRCFRLFEVGVDATGGPLQIPAHLLAAEARDDGALLDADTGN